MSARPREIDELVKLCQTPVYAMAQAKVRPADTGVCYGAEPVNLVRRDLFDAMMSSTSNRFEDRCKVLLAHVVNLTYCPEESLPVIKKKLSHFSSEVKIKWKAAQYKKRFLIENKNWLDTQISFPLYSTPPSTSTGRPSVDFMSSSERSKRRKTETLRSDSSSSELVYAAQMNLRAEGQTDAATVVKEMGFSTPTRPRRYKTAFKLQDKQVKQLTEDEGLSMFVEAKLNVHHLRKLPKRKSKSLSPEVIDLLLPPQKDSHRNDSETSDEEDDSSESEYEDDE
ncbi:hypothetical protein NQ318_022970 [Aromia moschata]|uniref:Uncharacterized protein n=1 Tax=Aromia moschata TaxID=1265417 RepID=A0AAV8YBE5_9CUCU|nr:hypothetical protein NQ318_022970 [Aromia moschata]